MSGAWYEARKSLLTFPRPLYIFVMCGLIILFQLFLQSSVGASAIRFSAACCRELAQKCERLFLFLHKCGGFHLFSLIPSPCPQVTDKAFYR